MPSVHLKKTKVYIIFDCNIDLVVNTFAFVYMYFDNKISRFLTHLAGQCSHVAMAWLREPILAGFATKFPVLLQV